MSLPTIHRALLIVTAGLLPVYLWRFSILGLPTNALEVLIVAAFAVGVLSPRIRADWRQSVRALGWDIKIFVLLFILASVISTLISPHLHTSLGVLKGWILLPILYGWMVHGCVQVEARAQVHILNTLILSAVAVSLFGLTQLGTLDRITSVYDVPNSLALFIAPVLVMSVFRALSERSSWLWLASGVMFAAVIGSQVVGAFVALIATLLIGGIWLRPIFPSVIKRMGVVGLIGVIGIGGALLWDRFEYLASPQSSAAVRLQLWSVSWDLIQQHPFLGVGLGAFEPAYQEKLHERFAEHDKELHTAEPLPEFVFRDPHNWILSFWLNVGVLGLLSFTLLSWRSIVASWKNQPEVSLALISILLLGLIDTIYWKNDLSVSWWLLIVCMVQMGRTSSILRK
ncbi:MAG: O-antigen ligase family protein [Candidatus Andersenbacteria bacterium]